jgi:hypothetical protein
MESGPVCTPFQYILIPADKDKEPVVQHFNGATDDELRNTLGQYFQQNCISVGQSAELREHLSAQVNKQMKENAPQEEKDTATSGMLDTVLSNSSTTFEIVPIIYPTVQTDYVGTSLYVDQVGVFKELPLNDRASQLASRAIRGDAFMLRSLDDPRSDEWRRVDCTLQFYQDLLTKPPNKAMEPMEQARAQQALQAAEQKEISSADAEEAQKLKQEGNSCFGNQQFEEATAKGPYGRLRCIPALQMSCCRSWRVMMTKTK